LPDHEAEEFHEFFGGVEDHHEVESQVTQPADVSAPPPAKAEPVNLAALGKFELIELLGELLSSRPVETTINEVENIKINYYKKHKAEVEKARKVFIEQGGELDDFKATDDPYENDIKELLRKYRDLKADYNKNLTHKSIKPQEKYKIIEEIKELVKNKESINRTFQEFRKYKKMAFRPLSSTERQGFVGDLSSPC
jgi:hypothetical protein